MHSDPARHLRYVVSLLAGSAVVVLLAFGSVALVAFTNTACLFNFTAWVVPSLGITVAGVLGTAGALSAYRWMRSLDE